jgi:Tol biopolymer transport system component
MLTILIAALLGGAPQQHRISFWTDAGSGHAQVWVMNEDGSGRRRLTHLFSAKRGDWSPDGRRLVFDGRFYRTMFDFDLGVMDADGSGMRRITRGPARDTQASWSPTGAWIAFSRVQPGKEIPEIWLVRPDGTGAHRIAAGGDNPSWSPDGRSIAFGGPAGIRTIRPDGSGLRRVTRADDGDPKWSPDGRRIAFTRHLSGSAEVYVVRSKGRRVRRLTRNPLDDAAAAWSPDGSRILYTHGPDGAHQVYVMNADGSGQTNLSRDRADEWATSWR